MSEKLVITDEDLAPVAVTSPEVRRFCNKFLRPLADRLSGGGEWDTVNLQWHTMVEGIGASFEFNAEYDDDSLCHYYEVEATTVHPVTSEWGTGVMAEIMYLPEPAEQHESSAQNVLHGALDEELDDAPDTDDYRSVEPIGYFAVSRALRFDVPPGGQCRSSKNTTLNILDEDHMTIYDSVAYGRYLADVSVTPIEDLENLFRFDEAVLDIPQHEYRLSDIYRDDLELVLQGLKSAKFVRSDARAL